MNLRPSLWSVVEQKVNPASAPAACAKWEVADIPSSSLRNRLRARGETLIYACGVVDAAGVPRGFLVASYMRRAPAVSDKVVFDALKALAADVNRATNDQARIKALTAGRR